MRLIDADKVEGIFKEACKTAYFRHNPQVKDGASAFMDCIRGLDTIDPESLKEHARWEKGNYIMKVTIGKIDNPCFDCNCNWYDSDFGCTCPSGEEWYQCPLEP